MNAPRPRIAILRHAYFPYDIRCRKQATALYDNGFDFSEGLAAVCLGRTWHYIDPEGRIRLSCPGCEAANPFRGGRARIVRDGRRLEIDRTGREFAI